MKSAFENMAGMQFEEIIGSDLTGRRFSELDVQFARLIVKIATYSNRDEARKIFVTAASVSKCTGEGNICLYLPNLVCLESTRKDQLTGSPVNENLTDWQRILENSGAVGRPGDFKPLILDGGLRLYLYRYWDYEKKLIEFIRNRITPEETDHAREGLRVDIPLLRDTLKRLFPPGGDEYPDWKKIAVLTSVLSPFCVISGSPGTGKTTTVAKILAVLLEQAKGCPLRISLAAPTGKAAVRLQEAIKKNKNLLNCADDVKAVIPESATTIHRLLGSVPDSPYFRYHSSNVLPYDIVIIDEASMVDLPLLSKLVQAMAAQTRLILLGDKDQLASVEAGTVLGDICGGGPMNCFSGTFVEKLKVHLGDDIHAQIPLGINSGVGDCMVELQKNYRFGEHSGIAYASHAVKQGDGKQALAIMKSGTYKDIRWTELSRPETVYRVLKNDIIRGFRNYLEAVKRQASVDEIFDAFEDFRVLCALREGPFGVNAVNAYIEQLLLKEKLVRFDSRWYMGRPIMVTHNDYPLRLFNGDVGIIMSDRDGDRQPRAFFKGTDGQIRKIFPHRLPQHETVYAMTVHKSQGSEFNEVLLVLSNWDSPLLTRELIYTGITRARKSVQILGDEGIFHGAVSRRIFRESGLRDLLWKNGA